MLVESDRLRRTSGGRDRPRIEAIYPLLPAQQGMLFDTLLSPHSGIHVEQFACTWRGALDGEAFRGAWERLLERHAALRAGFVWRDQETPFQVVPARVELPLVERDWRGLATAEQEARLAEHLAADRRRGFDLSRPPLLRLALFRVGEKAWRLVWTHHHILMDGWCRGLVLRELVAVYDALAAGREPELAPVRPFRDYIAWLGRRDPEAGERFWRRTLAGFREATALGRPAPPAAEPAGERHGSVSERLAAADTAALDAMARRHRLTTAGLVQGAWALLLGAYSGRRDVLFGLTTAGRPADLDRIEQTVGLFIHTVPVRLRLPEEAGLLPWLAELQSAAAELQQHALTPPERILSASEVPAGRPLYESVVVYENYPEVPPPAARGGASLEAEISGELSRGAQTRYAVTLLAVPGEHLELRLVHDRRRLGDAGAARMVEHLARLLRAMTASPPPVLGELLARVPAGEVPPLHAPPRRREGPESAGEAPRTPLEEAVAAVWAQVLGLERVGREESFLDLGGHSLAAAQLTAALRRAFQVELPLRSLFEAPTVAAMAAEIAARKGRGGEGETVDALPEADADPESAHLPFPLTEVQQAYWIGRGGHFDLGNVATHLYLELEGAGLELGRFGRAVRRLIERHGMLRAVMLADGRQRVLPRVPPYAVRLHDLAALEAPAAEAVLARIRDEMSHQLLPAERWPLFEVRASRLTGGRLRLHVSLDLLIGDAWSWRILARDLLALYTDPQAALPPLDLTFRDYVLAERALAGSELLRRSQEYWRRRLPSLPPAPELPLAVDPGRLDRPRFTRRSDRLGRGDWQRIKERATRAGLTASGLLLAAYAEVLALWSKSGRFTINLTLFNRLPLHPQVDRVVGDFTSLTLLEVDAAGGSFESRARRLQERLWDDLDHRYASGVWVMRELARQRPETRGAGMPVVFTSTLGLRSGAAEGEDEGEGIDLETVFALGQTPQVWLDLLVTELTGDLFFSLDAVDELFPAGLLDDLFAAFGRLVSALAEEATWERPDRSWLLPAAHRERLERLAASPPAAPGAVLHDGFRARAARCPDRPALLAAGEIVTYGALAAAARRLGRELRRRGAGVGSRVAVVMERGWEQAAAVLAVLEAGAAYLPVDPELPAGRRADLLARGGCRLALTQPHLAARLDGPPGLEVVRVEAGALAPDGGPRPAPSATPEDLAYVLFTSGSTGVPKGVAVLHGAAANTVADVNRRFGVGDGDRVLALSSLSFDLSVWDLFGLLAAGGALVLPAPAELREPATWAVLARRGRVTLWNTVPALLEMFVLYLEDHPQAAPPALRLALLSGDWIPVALPDRARWRLQGLEVVSLGGATEASIWSILFPVGEVAPDWRSIPYGRAMDGQSFHVLDRGLEPRPVWVAGELFIGGAGLAAGYWGDAARTAAAFLPDPRGGGRLYRTGDLGRTLPSGDIEFLGREDSQVKIQGFRVELGEVEAVLARHPAVQEVAAAAVGEARGAKRLVAWVVPRAPAAGGGGADEAHLLAWAADHLPPYLVPAALSFLPALPLTANGKVDRRALQTAAAPAAAGTERPRRTAGTPLEEMVAAVWAEVLEVTAVAPGDDFFDLGGQSLLATRAVSRLSRLLGVEIPLRRLFDHPTPAALAAAIGIERGAGGGDPIEPVPRDGALPLSFAQERFWFLEQLYPGTPVHHVPAAVHLAGRLDAALLERAFRAVERRQESLRTRFLPGDPPTQVVTPPAAPALPVVDLGRLSTAARQRLGERLGGRFHERPFDLAAAAPWRAALLRAGAAEHLLLLTLHHVAADGWSLGLLIRELSLFYRAALAGAPPPAPPLPIGYADFAVWQRRWLAEGTLAAQLDHWRRRLEGAPRVLELPTDRPRPPLPSLEGGRLRRAVGPRLAAAAAQLGRRGGTTLFMTLLAAFKVLVGRYTGRRDLLVGAPIAGRNRPEIEELIGLFVNTLVLRTRLDEDLPVLAALERVRETTLDAYDHQDLPFEKLVEELQPERDLRHPPLVQVVFSLQNTPLPAPPPGEPAVRLLPAGGEIAKFDLTLLATDTDDGLALSWVYKRQLFDAATIGRMARHFERLLAAMAASPDAPLAALPLLAAGERHQLLVEAAAHPAGRRGEVRVHRRIVRQAGRTPEAAAVVWQDRTLSYSELARRADRLARRLWRRGVGPEVPVGLFLDTSPDLAVAVLAVHQAGGAYLGLDRSQPEARLAFQVRDSQLPVVISRGALAGDLPSQGADVVDLDAETFAPAAEAATAAAPFDGGAGGDHLAYLIYTSGSTGRPKGVAGTHRQLTAYLDAVLAVLAPAAGSGFVVQQDLAVDAPVTYFFGALLTGGVLHLLSRDQAADASYVRRYLRSRRIDYLKMAPSHLAALAAAAPLAELLPRRLLLLGGESLSREWAGRILASAPGLTLLNHYGPTETTVGVLTRRVARGEAADEGAAGGPAVPLGRPLPGARVHVLDRRGRPLPAGVPGQLSIGGPGLSRGYLLRPGRTAAAFVPDPFGRRPGERLYASGDLARRLADGQIEFLGRIDHQVKVRGFRVELGEVEAALAAFPGVQAAAVVAEPGPGGDGRLVAYLAAAGEAPRPEALRQHLRRRLPEPMVPAAFAVLPALPRTAQGKVDRQALAAAAVGGERPPSMPPRTAAEELVAQIWSEVLGGGPVGVEESFFDVGGHSLLATRVVNRLRGIFQVELPLRSLFERPTVEGLVAAIAELWEDPAVVEEIAATYRQLQGLSEQEVRELLAQQEGG